MADFTPLLGREVKIGFNPSGTGTIVGWQVLHDDSVSVYVSRKSDGHVITMCADSLHLEPLTLMEQYEQCIARMRACPEYKDFVKQQNDRLFKRPTEEA